MIADWGVRPLTGAAELLYVDHHAAPEAVAGTVVLAPPGPPSSTSIVAWELLGRPPADEWLAALGAIGDLVDLGRLERPPRPASASAARRLAALVTAPGRLRAWFRDRFRPPPDAGDYARGHAAATGGSLTPEAFERFTAAVLAPGTPSPAR